MLKFIDLGREAYDVVWGSQHSLFDAMVSKKRTHEEIDEEPVLFVEHNHVFTFGRHADKGNMLVSKDYLQSQGIDCFEIERGGDVTYHGPGQLVVYPIIDLSKHRLGVKAYVNLLEQTVINTLSRFGIKGDRIEGATGVWIDAGHKSERKICAIGVRCSHSITMHGFALNVSTDLDFFKLINPCGFTDKGVTSMTAELHCEVSITEVKQIVKEEFTRLLLSV